MCRRWPNRLHFAGVVYCLPFALKRLVINDVVVQCRHLSSSGLLSIVSNHGKKKLKVDASEDTSSSHGVLGKIGKQRRTLDPIQAPPIANGIKNYTRPQNGVHIEMEKPLPKATSNVMYDDRWAKMINPGLKNGTKSHGTIQKMKPKIPSPKLSTESETRPKLITISEDITLKVLAHKIGVSIAEVEKILTSLGEPPQSSEDNLSIDAAELAALELGVHVKKTKTKSNSAFVLHNSKSSADKEEGKMITRPPVVTVMGHVDHGKTSLLDSLRQSSIAAGEAGGITQHIGAFEVALKGSDESLTFLDTPGHAAFSAMRARGVEATDLIVLVIAADDGVMPQTKECLRLIKQTSCPFVVAITKCDLPQADPSKVKTQLGVEEVELEDFGGTVQVVEVSSVTGEGLDDLQEALLLQATTLDLECNVQKPATGVVVEANKCKGLGPTVTVIVTEGHLRVGSPVIVGHHWGKIRQIKCPNGGALMEVSPGKPAEVSGIRGVPHPGDELMVVCDEDRAKRISAARELRQGLISSATNNNNAPEASSSQTKQINFLVKTDTQGTSEAVLEAIKTLSSEVISPHVLHHSVGNISEADVMFAEAANCRIIGFNVKPSGHEVMTLAQQKHIEIHQHTIIYKLLDTVGEILLNSAVLCEDEDVKGEAVIQQVFNIKCRKSKSTQNVAGCLVKSGYIQKSSGLFKLIRNEQVLFEGNCSSLKRHKLDVDRVGKGMECGVLLDAFNNPQQGDLIHYITKTKRKPKTETVIGGGIPMPAFLPTGSLTGLAFLAAIAVVIRFFRRASQQDEMATDDDTRYGTLSTRAMMKLIEDEVVRHFVIDLRHPDQLDRSPPPSSYKRATGGFLNIPTSDIRRVFSRRVSGDFSSRFPAIRFPRKEDLIVCVSDEIRDCQKAVQELEACGFDCSVYVRGGYDEPSNRSMDRPNYIRYLSRHAVALLLGLTDLPSPSDSLILDVRRMDELVVFGSIQGMKHLTVNELPKALTLEKDAFFEKYQFRKPEFNDVVVTSCRTCKRAIWAAQLLMEAGYKRVFVHRTGTYGWHFSPSVKAYDSYDLGDEVPSPKEFPKEIPNTAEGLKELENFNLVPITDPELSRHSGVDFETITNRQSIGNPSRLSNGSKNDDHLN
eukprot:g2882.t1